MMTLWWMTRFSKCLSSRPPIQTQNPPECGEPPEKSGAFSLRNRRRAGRPYGCRSSSSVVRRRPRSGLVGRCPFPPIARALERRAVRQKTSHVLRIGQKRRERHAPSVDLRIPPNEPNPMRIVRVRVRMARRIHALYGLACLGVLPAVDRDVSGERRVRKDDVLLLAA